ncbi:MAG TPA: hypothetical protein VJP80_06470 [Candidatus Saccharimonadales bacterium]|nr:hypothetical protein [Candidatus Saccharimonadales bacterium]
MANAVDFDALPVTISAPSIQRTVITIFLLMALTLSYTPYKAL